MAGSKPGERRGGRQKGTPNKTTGLLKDAILAAAMEVGSDGSGTGGLQGYCSYLARTEPKAYAALMGRVLPLQVTGDADNPLEHRVTLIRNVIVRPGDRPKT